MSIFGVEYIAKHLEVKTNGLARMQGRGAVAVGTCPLFAKIVVPIAG
jgi:hypothetical protein